MKYILAIFFCLLLTSAGYGITRPQSQKYLTPCTSGTQDCVITGITSTAAADTFVLSVQFSSAALCTTANGCSANDNQRDQISSVSDNATGSSNSYTLGSHVYNVTVNRCMQMAYSITVNPGVTSITVHLNHAAQSTVRLGVEFFRPSSGHHMEFDSAGTASRTTSSTSQVGASYSPALSGTNDAMVQTIASGNAQGVTAVSSPWTNDTFQASFGFAYLLNSTTSTAPTWTLGTDGSQAVVAGMAMKEVANNVIRRRVTASTE